MKKLIKKSLSFEIFFSQKHELKNIDATLDVLL